MCKGPGRSGVPARAPEGRRWKTGFPLQSPRAATSATVRTPVQPGLQRGGWLLRLNRPSHGLVEVAVCRTRFSPAWMLRPFSRLLRWPRWSCLLSLATETRVGHKPKPGDTSIERRCVGQRRVTTCPAGTAKEVPLLKDLGPTHCSKYFDVKLTGA